MNALLFLIAAIAVSGSDDSAAMNLNTKAQKMLQRGKLPEAAKAFARAAELASNDVAAAMLLRNQALTVLRMDDSGAARQLGEQALALVEQAAGSRDRHLTPILNTLAEVAISEGRYAEAAALLDRAIGIGQSAGPHFETAIRNRNAVGKLVQDPRATSLASSLR